MTSWQTGDGGTAIMTASPERREREARAGQRAWGDHLRAASSLLAVGLPVLERAYEVLPVAQRIREDMLPMAIFVTLLCVIAGYATARHSLHGLEVGWTSLVLFMAVAVTLVAFMDLIPRGDRALYLLCFALFGLSASSFLSIRRDTRRTSQAVYW